MQALAPAERERLIARGPELYRQLEHMHTPVGRDTGRWLYLLARSAGARGVVEFGTSFGWSTIALACALRDNGGGRLVTAELLPSKAAAASANLAAAGVADLVDVRVGDAAETLAGDLPAQVDLLLLDGHKPAYLEVLGLVLPHLRVGASVVADNADAAPAYLARVRASGGCFASMPLGGDVEWSVYLG